MIGINLNSPCLGCKSRVLYCHGSCNQYLNFKTTNQEISIARIKYKATISNVAIHNDGRCKV